MMTKSILIISCVLLFTLQGYSQTAAELKYQRESFEKQANELKEELINDVTEALNVDDFKKQIVTQSLYSYFDELTKIYMLDLPAFEKQDLVTQLDGRHFNDLKTILEQEQIDFILKQLKGDWKEAKKKKKRKKRKKN
jgi:hypothetical protein